MPILSHVSLRGFRNHRATDLELGPGLTILAGANGQGKTNVLEAVHYLSLLRSFRTHQPANLACRDTGRFRLTARLLSPDSGARAHRLAVEFDSRRSLEIDGAPVRVASEFINRFLCIALVPEDIQLVKGSAGERRRFLDILLSQVDPGYLRSLQDYQKVLVQRNALLRRPEKFEPRVLAGFEPLLIAAAAAVITKRRQACLELAGHLQEMFTLLRGAGPESRGIGLAYEPSVRLTPDLESLPERDREDRVAEVYAAALAGGMERDRATRCTNRGPHRDDLGLVLDGHRLDTFGSEGQCRLAALALRLAAGRLIRSRLGTESLVVLVDDVWGELDGDRRAALFSALHEQDQVLLAATRVPLEHCRGTETVFSVTNGTVTPAKEQGGQGCEAVRL
jgi:DNA replication and repair protein RecF